MIYLKSTFLAAFVAHRGRGSHAKILQGRHLQQEHTFSGPGEITSCVQGECTFDVVYDKLCHDACNTKGYGSFEEVPGIIMSNIGPQHDDGELCFHDKATNISTFYKGVYDTNPNEQNVKIEEGCKAT